MLRWVAFSRPVLFSILVIVLSSFLTEIPSNLLFESNLEPPAPELLKVTLGHTLTGLVLVWLKEARFTGPPLARACGWSGLSCSLPCSTWTH